MRTHAFIVNDSTFPSRLRHQFAGTGAKEKDDDISHLADIKRVRPDDFVLFYIEATTKVKGGFYGVFEHEYITFSKRGTMQSTSLFRLKEGICENYPRIYSRHNDV